MNFKITTNIKIITIPLLALIITFILLSAIENSIGSKLHENTQYKNTIDQFTKKDFFLNDFTEKRTMFLLGSSQVQFINVTQVNNLINNDDILVYNLAITSDVPVNRIEQLEKIISANPEIVFYGISYRDFQIPYDDELLPSMKQINLCSIQSNFPTNPKFITINFMQKITPKEFLVSKEKPNLIKNTPFAEYVTNIPQPINLVDDERIPAITQSWNNNCVMYENISALNTMISELQNNNIKIVIFTTPLHKFYLDSLSNYQKELFNEILDNLTKKQGVRIYELEDKYSELDMWRDHMHISIHESVTKYNEDIASIIIKESEI